MVSPTPATSESERRLGLREEPGAGWGPAGHTEARRATGAAVITEVASRVTRRPAARVVVEVRDSETEAAAELGERGYVMAECSGSERGTWMCTFPLTPSTEDRCQSTSEF
jgi:hypothetical protein